MNIKKIRIEAAWLILFFLTASAAFAQTTAFSYQGKLQNSSAPANGNFDFEFLLFDAVAGGTQIGSTLPRNAVAVANGIFSVNLDFGNQFPGANRFLEIRVRPTGSGAFTPLSPRQPANSSPYAVKSVNADNAVNATNALNATTAATATDATQLNGQPAAFYQNASNINSGTLDPTRLSVPLTLSGTSATHIIRAENAATSTNAVAVAGLSTAGTGTNYGVVGWSGSTSGSGVLGEAAAFTGTTYGVYGTSASTDGRGVFGNASANIGNTYGGYFESRSTDGRGVHGVNISGSGITYGVFGQSNSTDGRGVEGYAPATSGTNYGVIGSSASTDGRGVFGLGTAGSGITYGVFGQSNSTDGRGVEGYAPATSGTNYGVIGSSASTDGRGVFGWGTAASGFTYGVYGASASTNGRGVFGDASANIGNAVGVLGRSFSTGGWGVYSLGNMGSSALKPFRIDHPDDPANKYLLHYAAESPEVINFYSGKATLDGAGQAVVELPHYFAKINKDPRYTLTAVGAPMPMLHVAEEIDEAALSAGAKAEPGEASPMCSFRIAGGVPGARVSWRVEAIRNDRWVQKSGAPVEVEKQGLERGTYQHPELFGQPAEKGMNYDAERELKKLPEPVRRP